ncbi:MAG: histidine kinase, partial [Ruminococcaceae bacterium]|nr:histidine kinase [Oscillospiraceae bacterium]
MDTALIGGDFLPGSNGRPEKISGVRELFQR